MNLKAFVRATRSTRVCAGPKTKMLTREMILRLAASFSLEDLNRLEPFQEPFWPKQCSPYTVERLFCRMVLVLSSNT